MEVGSPRRAVGGTEPGSEVSLDTGGALEMAQRDSGAFAREVTAARWLAGLAAVSMCAGTLIMPAFWPGFSSVRETVSSLSAVGAPTRIPMTVFGLGTVVCLLGLAVVLKQAAPLGRALLVIASASAAMSLVIPKPTPHTDTPGHTAAVTFLAVSLGFWPLASFASRQRRWLASFRYTVIYTAVAIILGFTFLFNWLESSPLTGILERIFMFAELISTFVFTVLGTRRPAL